MVAVLSPGQGSQSAGMLAPWLALPGAVEKVGSWSELAELDLAAAGTTWSDEAIRDTAVAQPLLTCVALLSAHSLLAGEVPDVVCGHSIGELPALAVAGVLTEDEAIVLAALRGRAMATASRLSPTGMAAVLGGDPDEVRSAAARRGLEIATVNVAGQVVLGGPIAALESLAQDPPSGARVRRLEVAGAFHTSAMASARVEFERALTALSPAALRTSVIANSDGAVVTDAGELLSRLADQLTSPVRFDLCLQTLRSLGVAGVVELGPGGTLAAIVKRALPDVPLVALRSPDDLPAARALLHTAGEHIPVTWRALPSPEAGVVDPLVALGDSVDVGMPVAVVSGRAGASSVLAPVAGVVSEWLVAAGDPVRAGQLLAVLA